MIDNFGIVIQTSDRVRVLAYGRGGARLVDCGTASDVLALRHGAKHDRVEILDADSNRRSVRSAEVGVLRRDGGDGYEGNRPRCTCGARELEGCFCEISPRDFFASLQEREASLRERAVKSAI